MTLLQKPTAALECLSYEFESHRFQIAQNLFFFTFFIQLNNSLVLFLSHAQRKLYVDEGPGQTLSASS